VSAPKFTPGPWAAKDAHIDVWTRQVWTDEGHGSVMIATTGGFDKEANARLIAAAPELYAAGRAVVASWERGDLAGAVRSLAAAIAKAEGGTV